jgi:DNA-binding MarR family transcriptional regulator
MKTKSPPLHDYRTLLAHRVLVLSNTLGKGAVRLYAGQFGIPLAEWRLLATLALDETASVTSLASTLAVDKGWISRTARSMADKGLLTFPSDRSGSKHNPIQLTAAGWALYQEILPAAQERNRQLLDTLTDEELDTFARCVAKLQARAEQLTDRGGEE